MAVLGQNLCTPARIYGPIPQVLFCGCSVLSFNAQAGWNEQSSSMSIELIQDTCAGPRVWWDQSLARQSSSSLADPGFTFPEPGVAAYFRVEEDPDGATEADRGGFEYAGIVEGWTQKNDANGNPVYTVKLVDPRVIIENTQVIVNNFPGQTSGVWNLINAYGFIESLGDTCTSSPAQAIGGVSWLNTIGNQANSRGMVWNDVRCAISTLTAANNRPMASFFYDDWCRDARILYVGPDPADDGYGIIERDAVITDPVFQTIPNANLNASFYLIDIREIPFTPLYYRISGPNISLMEMISQVCQDAGCDYYVELLPFRNAGNVFKMIKVRVAVRSTQPTLGVIDDFIAAKQAAVAKANGGILAYTKGEEIRNESTSTYLIGGELRQHFEASASNMLPFWGLDINGDLIHATVANDEYSVRMDLSRLNVSLNTPFAAQFQWITERELRAALSDIDAWKEVTHFIDGDFAVWLRTIKQHKRFRQQLLMDALNEKLPAAAISIGGPDANSLDKAFNEAEAKDLEMAYEFVRTYADEFYGKQWLVNATSFVCFTTDPESSKLRYSHEPSTEGCWVNDDVTTVIGLTHDSTSTDFFRDETGKYQPIVKFPLVSAQRIGGGAFSYTADPSKLGDDNYITDGVGELWVKAEVDERWVMGTPLVPAASTISFLLKTNAPVTNNTSDTNNFIEAFGGLDILLDDEALINANPLIQDRGQFALGALHFALAPSAALAPTLNHVQVYGAWGVAGLPGQVDLETDDGFVPWEYGSDTIMNQAAYNKVSDSVTQMRKGERGSITVAGLPNIPLGAELFSVDSASPPHSQGTQKYLGTRVQSLYQCSPIIPHISIDMNEWTGEFGPNVTNITVNAGAGGFTTEYQFSTYTPTFGRFNKDNAERLKQVGQTRLSNMRNIRAQNALRRQVGASIARGRQILLNQLGRTDRVPKSAHHTFVGRYLDVGPGYRNELASHAVRELTLGISTDAVYAKSAIMSMDGLLRPVSKAGDGNLSQYTSWGGGYCTDFPGHARQSDPPVRSYTGLAVTLDYLDALANPSSSLPTDRSDTALSGHDIEILARGSTPPQSGWAITEGADNAEGYSSDYRFFALRGPLLIQQWGYDLEGKPVPNKADAPADARAGSFQTSTLHDKFMDGWLQDPKSWPLAPLDLRLDRDRGVWTTPQPPRPVHVTPTGFCLLSSSGATVNNSSTMYKADGTTVTSKLVDVAWPWTIAPPTGIGKIPTYYDNVDCKYYAYPINRLNVGSFSGWGENDDERTVTSVGNVTDEIHDTKRLLFQNILGLPGSGCKPLAGNGLGFAISGHLDSCSRDVYVSITGSPRLIDNATGTWSLNYICGINVNKDGSGYVKDVNYTCANLTGFITECSELVMVMPTGDLSLCVCGPDTQG
jgi:hypothetical protein